MKTLFVLAMICFIAGTVLLLLGSRDKRPENGKNGKKLYRIFTAATLGVVVILGVVQLIAGFASDEYRSVFVLMGLAALVQALLIFWSKKRSNSKVLRFAAKALFVSAMLELTLFNIPSYRLWFGDYPEVTLTPSQADEILGNSAAVNDNGEAENPNRDWIMLEYRNLDIPIRNVYADVYFTGDVPDEVQLARFVIDIKDQSQTYDYRSDLMNSYISGSRQYSAHKTMELSGNVTAVKAKFLSVFEGTVTVRSITFNRMIPFTIIWIRFLFIALVSAFVYAVMNGALFRKSICEKELFCRISVLAAAAVCSFTAFGMINYSLRDTKWSQRFTEDSGNQVTRELVEAFEKKHVYLDDEPEKGLMEMDNPYERWERDIVTGYKWDHVFYEGKYYSYYGIAPVILLYLPYHKLTGHYFPTDAAVALFSMIGFFGLAMLYHEIMRRFAKKTSVGLFLTGLVMLMLSCGIWFSVTRPDFYEGAVSSGFAFLTWGCYFLFSANVLGKGKISLPRTAIASLLTAIAVLCRPTLVLYCICAAILLLTAIKRSAVTADGVQGKLICKRSILYILCAFVPMAALGLCQMWYNHARFGSPFEFGIQYSLTINNFVKTQFHPALSWIAIYNFFFNSPVFSSGYPFIYTSFQYMGVSGFFFNDESTGNTSGLLWLAPTIMGYLFAGKALRKLPDRLSRIKAALIIGLPCVIIPAGIVASVWESGYTARYMVDIAWPMILGSYVLLFFLYSRTENETLKRMMRGFFCISMIWSLIIGGTQIFNCAFRYTAYNYKFPEMMCFLQKLFIFWA